MGMDSKHLSNVPYIIRHYSSRGKLTSLEVRVNSLRETGARGEAFAGPGSKWYTSATFRAEKPLCSAAPPTLDVSYGIAMLVRCRKG